MEIPAKVALMNHSVRIKEGRKENVVSYVMKKKVNLSPTYKLKPIIERKEITKRILELVEKREGDKKVKVVRKRGVNLSVLKTNVSEGNRKNHM